MSKLGKWMGLAASVLAMESFADSSMYREISDTISPTGSYNVVTYAAPRAITLKQLGLREAGLTGGKVFRLSDEIRVFVSRDKIEQSPKARLWLNTRENAWWYHTGGEGSAEDFELLPGEVMMIITRGSKEPIFWKNPLATP